MVTKCHCIESRPMTEKFWVGLAFASSLWVLLGIGTLLAG